MSNKEKEQERYFDFLKRVMKESGYQDLSYKFVYHHLTRYGIPAGSHNLRLSEQHFDAWCQRFRDNPNIDALVDPKWPYFCQFIPSDQHDFNETRRTTNHIKLYIPLAPTYMYEGVNQIFDFLAEQRIPHVSKVGTHIRNDSVVIRLVHPEDSDKVIKFVKNNKYLQRGLLKTNPFAPNESGVGYASDGRVSFNETIASLISYYINYRKNRGEFKYIGANDFNDFVANVYKSLFGDKRSAEEVFDNNPFFADNGLFNYINNPTEVYSLKIVLGLYLETLQKDFTKEKYYDFYEKTLDEEGFMLEENYNQEEHDKETVELLRRGMLILTERYESSDAAFQQLNGYVQSGDLQLITSQKGLRDLYQATHFDKRVRSYLLKNHIELKDVINSFNIYRKKEITNVASHLRHAFDVLEKKKGYANAYHNICGYLTEGDPAYITRDYGLRQKIGESTLRDKINRYIETNGLTVDEFVASLTGGVKKAEDYLEDACRYTRGKYDSAHEKGDIKTTGLDWTTSALVALIQNFDYEGFTRDNDSRKNLIALVTRQKATEIVARELGITPSELSQMDYYELRDKCKMYVRSVTEIDLQKETSKL